MSENSSEQIQLLTLKEAAVRLSISKRSLEREISSGKFPRPLKIGRSSRVTLAMLRAYVLQLGSFA